MAWRHRQFRRRNTACRYCAYLSARDSTSAVVFRIASKPGSVARAGAFCTTKSDSRSGDAAGLRNDKADPPKHDLQIWRSNADTIVSAYRCWRRKRASTGFRSVDFRAGAGVEQQCVHAGRTTTIATLRGHSECQRRFERMGSSSGSQKKWDIKCSLILPTPISLTPAAATAPIVPSRRWSSGNRCATTHSLWPHR